MTAILYEHTGAWHLPFVTRRQDLSDHPGQVALPGGKVEPGEDAWAAAAREAKEEIAVPADALVPLGATAPVYTSVSNYSVVPFVAWLPAKEAFVHDPGELEGVLEIPLDRLLAEEDWIEFEAERSGGAGGALPPALSGRYFPWNGSIVWGLTARILADILPVLRSAREASR